MKEDRYAIDEEIQVPDELSNRIESRLANIKKPRAKGKPIAVTMMTFMLVGILAVSFNPQINAYASKLPVLGDIIAWFKSDDGVEYAREHGYPTFEAFAEQDGYKVYIKDFYIDQKRFSMKFAVVDDNGDYLTNYNWSLKDTKHSYTIEPSLSKLIDRDPWINVDAGFPKMNSAILRDGEFNFDLHLFGERDKFAAFDGLSISLEDMPELEKRVYPMSEVIETEFGDIKFENFEITPSAMYVRYRIEGNEGYLFDPHFDLSLEDDKGNEHKVVQGLHGYKNRSGRSYERKFSTSIYFDADIEKLKLVVKNPKAKELGEGINVSKSDEVQDIPIWHLGKMYTITKVEWNYGNVDVRVESAVQTEAFNFPNIAFLDRQDNWTLKEYRKDNQFDLYSIKRNEAEIMFDDSIENVLDLEGEAFREATKSLKSRLLEIAPDCLEKKTVEGYLEIIKDDGYVLLADGEALKTKERIYTFKNAPKGGEYQLSVLEHKEQKASFEVEIDLE